MNNVKGLILCGGPGVRLRPITYYFQKTMVPVGTNQKPMLEYVVQLLRFHGIVDLTFLVDYKAEQIMNYFDDGSRFNLKISHVHDSPRLRGTVGSVINAYNQGIVNRDNTLLVYYGDILTNMNLKRLLQYHEAKQASATVALSRSFSIRVGLADLNNDGKIRGFVEKPKIEKPVSIGIIVLAGDIIKDMKKMKKTEKKPDLMKNLIPYLIEKGRQVYGYLSDSFWYDVGSTEAYEKLKPKLVEDLFAHLFE